MASQTSSWPRPSRMYASSRYSKKRLMPSSAKTPSRETTVYSMTFLTPDEIAAPGETNRWRFAPYGAGAQLRVARLSCAGLVADGQRACHSDNDPWKHPGPVNACVRPRPFAGHQAHASHPQLERPALPPTIEGHTLSAHRQLVQ